MSFANTLKYVFKATSANFGNMLPYTQLSRVFGFTPMPLEFLPVLAGILFLFIATAEVAKKIFYQRVRF